MANGLRSLKRFFRLVRQCQPQLPSIFAVRDAKFTQSVWKVVSSGLNGDGYSSERPPKPNKA
jgi:hypothetical protein